MVQMYHLELCQASLMELFRENSYLLKGFVFKTVSHLDTHHCVHSIIQTFLFCMQDNRGDYRHFRKLDK